jgi:hypothetical protein
MCAKEVPSRGYLKTGRVNMKIAITNFQAPVILIDISPILFEYQ